MYFPLADSHAVHQRGKADRGGTTAIGARHGKGVGQVVLRFLMDEGVVVIPKSSKPARMAENIDVFDFELSGSEYADLTDALDQLEVHGDRKDEDIARLGALRMELFGGTGVH